MDNTIVWGPYTPVNPSGRWSHRSYTVTARHIIETLVVYATIMQWRGHTNAMRKSQRHAETMMGEIDEPTDSEETYDPMRCVSFFSTVYLVRRANELARHNRKITDPAMHGALTQLVFAIIRDDDALAKLARYRRTGYLGSPSDIDITNTSIMRDYLSTASRRGDAFVSNIESGEFDIPLMQQQYRGWSNPILIPAIEVAHDDE